MNIHILMPFRKIDLIPTLIHYYKDHNIIWHPLFNRVDNLIEHFKDIKEEWIKPFLWESDETNRCLSCFGKCNAFVDAGDIIDEDYYGFIDDDSMYEPGFFDMMRQQTAKIVINSNYRGDTVVGFPHPPGALRVESIDDMREQHIGFGMYFVKGEILKQSRYIDQGEGGDGIYCASLRSRWPNDVAVMSDWYVFGNYFQRGRNVRRECLLKPNWELPKFL